MRGDAGVSVLTIAALRDGDGVFLVGGTANGAMAAGADATLAAATAATTAGATAADAAAMLAGATTYKEIDEQRLQTCCALVV